jgi:hypothetical protein
MCFLPCGSDGSTDQRGACRRKKVESGRQRAERERLAVFFSSFQLFFSISIDI